jgi:hypothetical protein
MIKDKELVKIWDQAVMAYSKRYQKEKPYPHLIPDEW